VVAIESVYAVLEVKQTLTMDTLDDAMSKIVRCHRLFRPLLPEGRITENRGIGAGTDVGNPLFSAIVGVRYGPGVTAQALLDRFIEINQNLKRLEVIQCLCILGEASFMWGWKPDNAQVDVVVAPFNGRDLTSDLYVVEASPKNGEPALSGLVSRMLSHLTNVVLSPTDFSVLYGAGERLTARDDGATVLPADPDWSPMITFHGA
jgi:hypothetical protein